MVMSKQHTLIIGMGKTGVSIARHLHASQQKFSIYDTRPKPLDIDFFTTTYPEVAIYCQSYPAELLDTVDKIICSPGVAMHEIILQDALRRQIPIENDLDCLMKLITAPVIGITGSNGKSTVTTLLGLMCKAQGLNTAVGGNLGTPVLDLYYAHKDYDIWVLELSSFQLLHAQELKLKAATILNISPDHIDYHGSMSAYVAAKHRIYTQAEMLLCNRDDVLTVPRVRTSMQQSFGLSAPNKNQWGLINTQNGPALAYENEVIIQTAELKMQGRHNWLNALAACALARSVGITDFVIKQVLQTFPGLEHRTESVGKWNGISFINDSKGTNLGATYAAIEGLGPTLNTAKIVLIAGGQGKGADFSPMRELLRKYVRHVVLIGQDAALIAKQWRGCVAISHAKQLRQAVYLARELAAAGDVVLLSPACASLDMFKNYEDRGQQFIKLVQEFI